MSRYFKPALATLTAAALIVTAGLPTAAIAQDGEFVLEEVVVTARKREERLLDVPLSITALTAGDIEAKGINEFKDVIDFTPGFFFAEHSVGRGDRSNRLLVVRGMRINTENDHQQAATVFVDGVPMLGSVVAGLEDAERVEIVRGPQSAYFGRSTFAGAVNFVSKTPSDEFQGKVIGEAGNFGTSNFGLQMEGPLTDSLAYRIAGSQWQTDGQWELSNDPTVKLGARKTFSIAGTLFFTPNDRFSAKLRVHSWRDDDGPSAAFGYGIGNGESYFNCNLPNSPLAPRNGPNNWICGEAPFPRSSEIQGDFVVTPEKQKLLNGIPDAGFSLDSAFIPSFLEGFGLERRADQASLIMDYEFENGMVLTSATAYHSNEWQALDDLDRRYTGDLGSEALDVTLLNGRDLEDFSQELRLSSPADGRLRWTIGASLFDFEGVRTSGFKVFGAIRSFSFGNTFDIQTSAIFGSIEYDINDQLTLSVEARQQKDDLTEARTTGAETASGSFNSFTPRVILDWSFNDDITVYASYGEGTRPGAFNTSLLGQPQSVLDQMAQAGVGLSVPEEELQNFEIGIKGQALDGRARFSAAIYSADWDAQSAVGVPVTRPDGSPDFLSGGVVGGKIDLFGFEFEGIWAATEHLTLEATYSLNEAEIKVAPDCGDCALLLGNSDISGLGKQKSRSPETQASLSGTYARQFNEEYDWFARLDYIYTGSRYATDANVTETGDSQRFNLRAGIENDNLRLEVYGENLFEDETFTNYQFLLDFAYFGNRILTAGLPDKRQWGVRASYSF
jgi:iron complex outermembrane receptor protein